MIWDAIRAVIQMEKAMASLAPFVTDAAEFQRRIYRIMSVCPEKIEPETIALRLRDLSDSTVNSILFCSEAAYNQLAAGDYTGWAASAILTGTST